METNRKPISKKTRFEVFKRDGFKCQYCGASAPDVLLEVDHIQPVSKAGKHDLLNFTTACKPCNLGKSNRVLSDDSAVKKQQVQLAELHQRRQQIEMMLRWRDCMKEIEADQVELVAKAWNCAVAGWRLNDAGLKGAKKLIKDYGLQRVLDAIDTAADTYVRVDLDGRATSESVAVAWKKVGGICALAGLPADERRLYYVKAILVRRFDYVPFDVMEHLKAALEAGTDVAELEGAAKRLSSWYKFLDWLYEV